ncbi:MAG: YceI family protein [Gemmatimonadota bacterium]|nr:YceI family protein [Gemmatimonadota bacterium]
MNVNTICRRLGLAFFAAFPLVSCSRGEPQTAFADAPAKKAAAASDPSSVAPGTALRFVLSPTGNAARYRVRERLVGHDLPNDAIGETKSLTGAIAFDANGKIIRPESKFVVDAGSFVSDKDRRDGFVRGRLLDAQQYPSIVLVPTDVRGIGLPLPTSGTRPIEMMGDLTVRGVTRPTLWKGTAQFQDGRVSGSASTEFTFADIRMDQPRVPVLLSVADTIRLEIDFDLVRQR